ncbi:hypothetical protein GQ457_17G009430 [Hibiscus cannabinus]
MKGKPFFGYPPNWRLSIMSKLHCDHLIGLYSLKKFLQASDSQFRASSDLGVDYQQIRLIVLGSEVVEQRFALKPSHLSFLVLASNYFPYVCGEIFLVFPLELSSSHSEAFHSQTGSKVEACESGLVQGNARPSDVEGYSLVKRRGFRKCITNPWRDTHLGIGVSLPLRRTKLGYRA